MEKKDDQCSKRTPVADVPERERERSQGGDGTRRWSGGARGQRHVLQQWTGKNQWALEVRVDAFPDRMNAGKGKQTARTQPKVLVQTHRTLT